MLNHKQVEAIQPTGKREKHSLGKGLFLSVSAKGKKTWLVRLSTPTGPVEKSLGSFPEVGLGAARKTVDEMRAKVANHKCPLAVINKRDHLSFASYYEQWQAMKATGPKPWQPKYVAQTQRRFERHVLPTIGAKRITEITPQECLRVIQKVEEKGRYDLARKMKQFMEGVFNYAKFDGHDVNPMQGINSRLKPRPEVRHRPSLGPKEMVEFYRRLASERGLQRQTRALMEITIRTMVRTNEIRFGQWSEIEGDLWTIPAKRMKMSRPHVVPLVPQVVELFEELRDICNDPDEWGAHRGTNLRPEGDDMCAISENGMLCALYRMGYKHKATMHGFRATASTYLYSTNKYRDAAIELQLAHKEKNQIKSAYNHHDYLDERWKLMRDWNRFLDEKKATGEMLV